MTTKPNAIHHAILLTDGKDENETEAELDAAIRACEGHFQCDCRGIGTDWAVSELRQVSSALLGSIDMIRDPSEMEVDFQRSMETAMSHQVEASIQVWTPRGATIRFVRQVSPTIEDLTSRGRQVGPRTTEFPTGAWGVERREYHLEVDVHPGTVGNEMLAARVNLVVGDRVLAKSLVRAIWTDEPALFTPINDEVAHYTGQAELAGVIQVGLQALRHGDPDTATAKLGRAVQLAAQSGNEAMTTLLANIVDVYDADKGTVRLKSHVDASDEMVLDTRSTRTTRVTASTTSVEEGFN